MSKQTDSTRRDFLKTSTATAGAALAWLRSLPLAWLRSLPLGAEERKVSPGLSVIIILGNNYFE